MFVPMAFTVMAALLGSLVLALTFVPAAARTFLLEGVSSRRWPAFERLPSATERLMPGDARAP
jgi:heavy metal efflux system protein